MSKSNLAAKLARVTQSVTGLTKDGYNSHHKYKFVSHDSVVNSVSMALAAEGVDFTPQIVNVTKEGKNYLIETLYRFTDSESGEAEDCRWFGEGQDSQDKGLYKAVTQAKKTFLLNKFLIATGEQFADGDYGQGYESKKAAPPKPAPPKPKLFSDLAPERQQKARAMFFALAKEAGVDAYEATGQHLTKDATKGRASLSASTEAQVGAAINALKALPKKNGLPVSEATRQAATANGVIDPTKFDPIDWPSLSQQDFSKRLRDEVKAKDVKLHAVLADARISHNKHAVRIQYPDGYDWQWGKTNEAEPLLKKITGMDVVVELAGAVAV